MKFPSSFRQCLRSLPVILRRFLSSFISAKNIANDHKVYSQHRIDPEVPIEKTIEAMVELKKEGKIRYLGLSECSARTLERAHRVHPIAAVEMEYSAFALEIEAPETNFLKTARALGVVIVPYSPLGRGFLTGSIKSRDDLDEKDVRRMFPRFSVSLASQSRRCLSGA